MSFSRAVCCGLLLFVPLPELTAQAESGVSPDPLPRGAHLRMGTSRLLHGNRVTCVQFSPDDSLLATADSDGEVRFWEVATGRLIWRKPKGTGEKIAFSPDGKTLAIGGFYNRERVWLWDLQNDELIREWKVNARALTFSAVAFSPIANHMVAPGEFGIFDPQTGQQLIKLDGEVGVYGCVAYSHDGKLIASGNGDGYVQLWDAATGKQIVRRWGHEGGIRCVDFSPDGTLAASVSRKDASIRIWGTTTGKQLAKIPLTWRGPDVWWSEEGSNVLFAPYGGEVITWTYDSLVHYWQLGSLDQRTEPLGETSLVSATFSCDGTRAAVVRYDSSRLDVAIYELDGGSLIATLKPLISGSVSSAWISSIAFSPDGQMLAVGFLDNDNRESPVPSVQLWNIQQQKIVRRIRPAISPPGKICFSPDGTRLVTSPTSAVPLQVWRTADGSEEHRFPLEADAHGRDPVAIDFSPDGKLLAAANHNDEIYVWELATWNKIRTFSGHQKAVTSIAFSPDGSRLLSGSEDTTMLVWQINDTAPAQARLTQQQLEGYWDALADLDPDVGIGAVSALLSNPEQTIELMESRLTAGDVLDEAQIPKLITDLCGPEVRISLKAAAKLKAYGRKASPPLFRSLSQSSDVEVRRRIEDVLQTVGEFPIPPAAIQRTRAIGLLEQIGNDRAEEILSKLADTKPPTPASVEAEAALNRLKRRLRAPRASRQ